MIVENKFWYKNVVPKKFVSTKLSFRNIWVYKNVVPKKKSVNKEIRSSEIWVQKMWVQKMLFHRCGSQKFGSKISWVQNIVGQKNGFTKKCRSK